MNDRPFDMPQIRPSRLSLFANATIGLLSRLLPPPAEQPRFSWNRGTINELVTVASDLTGVYPDRRFFGIGHGPSFVVHAIGRLGSREKVPVEADHVPFSGSFVEPITGSAHIVRTHCLAHAENFRMVEGKNPSLAAAAQNRSAYEALLTGMGLHPFRIVDDFARTGIRTAFIDVAGKKGIGSLVSFVDFFYEFAGEHDIAPSKIQQAIDIIVLSSRVVTRPRRPMEHGPRPFRPPSCARKLGRQTHRRFAATASIGRASERNDQQRRRRQNRRHRSAATPVGSPAPRR
jgi:hypothetical protein